MSDKLLYENPLTTRYASREMLINFGDEKRFRLWRQLWVALAESEMELGLPITKEQVEELKAHIDDIDYERAEEYERQKRHDVMAHVAAFGDVAPSAKGIIHLGATSCFVDCNSELIIMRDALDIIEQKLVNVMDKLRSFALRYKDLPTLGFTHLQPAQLTTVGKRATLWLQDLMLDYESLQNLKEHFKLRGVKGTTGTQASFLELFDGDEEKVKELERRVVKKMGYEKVYGVTGQTYPRKFDYNVLCVLSQIAQSAYKFSNDIRLLQHMKEVEEPFEKTQVGSSAMAYKRNPMRSERICSLARYVTADALNPAITASTQWLERTLDDSANKRISVAEAFLATDAILNLYINITEGLVVYPKMAKKHLRAELPFMATENILMDAVKRGGDRQELHEKIRQHSQASAKAVKEEGADCDLLTRIAADPAFGVTMAELEEMMKPENFVGCAPMQTEAFLREYALPAVEKYADDTIEKAEITV